MKKAFVIFALFFATTLIAQTRLIDSLKQVILQTPNDTHRITSLNLLSEKYIDLNKDTALAFVEQALKISKDKNIIEGEIDSYTRFGIIYIYKKELEKSIVFFNKGLEKSIAINSKKNIASINYLIGVSYYNLDEYYKALEFYKKSITIGEQNNFPTIILNCYNAIGVVNKELGNYDIAIKNYLESLSIAEKEKNTDATSAAFNNIGIIYKTQGLYTKALEYFKKSLKIDLENDNKHSVMLVYLNFGVVYKHLEKFENALSFYKKALKLAFELDNKSIKAKAYTNISIVYKKLKLFDEALKGLEQSLKYNKEIGNLSGQARVYENKAGIYLYFVDSLKQNKNLYLKKALHNSLKAYEIAVDLQIIETIKNASEILKEVYKRMENYPKSLYYADIFNDATVKIYDSKKLEIITELEIKYKNEKDKLLIEKLQKEKELRNQKIQTQELQNTIVRRQIIGLVIIVILLMAFLIYSLITLRRNKKLNLELGLKSQEIKTQYLQSLQQNIEIEVKAKEIEKQKQIVIENHKRIKQIDDDYKSIIDSNTDIVFIISKEGEVLFINSRSEMLLGRRYEDIIGENFTIFVPEDNISGFLQKLKDAFSDRTINSYESYMKHKDGHHIPVEISGQIVKYKGEMVGAGTIRDITDRKVAEQEIKDKTRRYELVTNAIEDLIWMVDFNMKFIYASPSCKQTIGYKEEELFRKELYNLFTNDSLKRLNKIVARAKVNIDKNERVTEILEYIHKDGRKLEANIVGHIVFEDNEAIGFAAVSRFFNKSLKFE